MSKPIPPYDPRIAAETDFGYTTPPYHPDYDRFIRLKEVLGRIDVAKSTLYGWIKDGQFPRTIKVGRNTFWSENAINQWMNEQKAKETES